jgi:hypothetical protein
MRGAIADHAGGYCTQLLDTFTVMDTGAYAACVHHNETHNTLPQGNAATDNLGHRPCSGPNHSSACCVQGHHHGSNANWICPAITGQP